MRILAYNPGHDGSAVQIENERLTYALESEKDSGVRHDAISTTLFLRSLRFQAPPDVVAISGYYRGSIHEFAKYDAIDPMNLIEAGYWDHGPTGKTDRWETFAGHRVRQFSSSHVRSHILCSYGLSPFPQGQPCYALIWEGHIGAFYYVDEDVTIRKVGDVMMYPGSKYLLLYPLAGATDFDAPGKIMALAAYGHRRRPTVEERELIDTLLSLHITDIWKFIFSPQSSVLSKSRYYRIGIESQDFKDLAWQFSAALFDRFHAFAREHVKPGLPLLIAGGCGLNCEWNSEWKQCGLFSDVFVPPCPNDSGVALGAAVDALHHYTGHAKIDWSVYAGDPFVEDVEESADFECRPLNLAEVGRALLEGDVIAWVQGRYEIGPRALGNRSLLAAPFSAGSRDKLNRIKGREGFRPIAPICLEEDFGRHFEHDGPSPHMLYFQRVKSTDLEAVTHVDGSARAQSVNELENPAMCALLREFREQSGTAILCNTSLNFNGRGFINRLSQLFILARDRGIDGMVVGNRYWRPRRLP